MKKSINSKILATAVLAVISPSLTNEVNAKEVSNTHNSISDASYGHPNQLKNVGDVTISNRGISDVYNELIQLDSKERAVVALKIRNDFQGFMNEHFVVNTGENYCLSRTWKTDERCLKFINDMATAIEKGHKLQSFNLDEVGLNTIPYAKRKPAEISLNVSTNTDTGVTTVSGGIKFGL